MKRICTLVLTTLLAASVLSACGGVDVRTVLQGPTAVPGVGDSSMPSSDVLFSLQVPADTPSDAEISLETVDLVTGVSYNGSLHPLSKMADESWGVHLTLPVGTLLRYRYVLTSPSNAVEATTAGEAVRYRDAHIVGGLEFIDIVASWGIERYEGPQGRILGRVADRGSGEPVGEMVVSAAGQSTFTDAEGRFRLEGLPPGLHNVIVYDPDGSHRTAQQGAVVAADSTTPAEFEIDSALPVTLTFELTIPTGGPTTPAPRIAGNVRLLGAVFAGLPGGVEISAARTPTLVQVDPTHYLFLGTFYAGTDLRYKYTLGDGLWNAERDADDRFVTRQWIVPETDAVTSDEVAAWNTGEAPLVFNVQAPSNTPPGDDVSLQLRPFTWFEPLPMTPAGDGRWQSTLYGPLDFGDALSYRFCRNLACGAAGDGETRGPDSKGRSASLLGNPLPIDDKIDAWAWWQDPIASGQPLVENVEPRPNFDVGVEFAPLYQPAWIRYEARNIDRATNSGAQRIVLTPAWLAVGTSDHPRIEFDPSRARFTDEVIQQAATARERGLSVALRPELVTESGTLRDWWRAGNKNINWWSVFYDELRSFLLTEAQLAERSGADTLILTGAQLAPSLPGDGLAGGLGEAPYDAEARWRLLLTDLRGVFHGRLALELELTKEMQPVPVFVDSFDEIHVYWHAPLSDGDNSSFDDLRQEAGRLLDSEVIPALPEGKPIIISIEYLSVAGSAQACPPNPDGSCRPAAAFDGGAAVDGDIGLDLSAQAEAIEAVMAESSARSDISGVTIRRYNPLAALQDKSASVYGKPAGDVIRTWYRTLSGDAVTP
ncbi:MAG: carboxypeptidase regulatory-like domain-containing protein [Anaerolineales bacterium]